MGYEGEKKVVPHGFRATASTILNESGLFKPDIIERQLAHVEEYKVRAEYNHAQYLDERRKMMQWLGGSYRQLEEQTVIHKTGRFKLLLDLKLGIIG